MKRQAPKGGTARAAPASTSTAATLPKGSPLSLITVFPPLDSAIPSVFTGEEDPLRLRVIELAQHPNLRARLLSTDQFELLLSTGKESSDEIAKDLPFRPLWEVMHEMQENWKKAFTCFQVCFCFPI
jgi:hypothetical protein